jgi:hypothetical protein
VTFVATAQDRDFDSAAFEFSRKPDAARRLAGSANCEISNADNRTIESARAKPAAAINKIPHANPESKETREGQQHCP